MRLARLVVALLAVSTASAVWCQDAPKKPDAKPIATLGWLVGGVWTADTSKAGPGVLQRIETRYEWSDNNAYIRFNTHFVSEKQTARQYDGNFFWDPAQSTLALWYMDARNSIIECPVNLDGDVMKMSFRAHNFEGKMSDLRVNVTRKTPDHYTWTLEEKQQEGWKQLTSLEYLRVAGS